MKLERQESIRPENASAVKAVERGMRAIQMFNNILENATVQETPETRENYLRACESHVELKEIVSRVRGRFGLDYSI